MANAMTPPTQPNPMRPPVNTIPTPVNALIPPVPMPPPPTGTGLGFAQWAQDPANAMKVMPSMTAPDKPLQPGTQQASAAPPAFTPMASVMPPKPTPMASVMPPQMPPKPNFMIPPGQAQLDTDTQKLRDLQSQGAGLNQIQNPVLRGLARAGDIVAPFLIGGGTAAIPGTTLHNRYLQGQQADVIAGDQQAQQNALGTQKTQLEIQNLQNPRDKFTPLQTDDGTMAFDPSTGTARPVTDPNGNAVAAPSKPVAPHYVTTPEGVVVSLTTDANGKVQATEVYRGKAKQEPQVIQGQVGGKPHNILIDKATGATIRDLGETGIKPPTVNVNQGTYSMAEDGQGNPVLFNNKTGETKASTGVQKSGTAAKANAPYQTIVDEAQNAHQLADMASKGNAPADVDLALSFFKTMRGAGGAGIRFTQAEQNLIMSARSMSGDLQASAQKVLGGGQKFTPKQRADILQVIDMHAKAAQDHINGGAQPVQNNMTPPSQRGPKQNNMVPPSQRGGPASTSLPPQVASQLQEGVVHTFGNGQQWTKTNGQPVRVK